MIAKLVDTQTPVYAEPDRASAVVTTLSHGEDLLIVDQLASGAAGWIPVALADGRPGYLPGGTKIERFPVVELDQDATIRVEQSEAATALVTYGMGARLQLLDTVLKDGHAWLEVADGDGHRGFIPGGTRLEGMGAQSTVQAVNARAKRDLLIGGLWCGGGLAVTLYTHVAASGGGTYVVAWGAIIFGGWQFVKGLIHYTSADEA